MIKINGTKYRVREANDKDRPLLLSWYNDQGWENRNLFTSKLSHCVVMVAVDEDDNPVSTVSYIYLGKFINLNSFVTDSKIRGNGLGRLFWDYVLDQFGKDTNLYLKSVDPMTEKYKNGSGFLYVSTVHCRRYLGHLSLSFIQKIIDLSGDINSRITIKDVLNETSIKSIINYDKHIHREDCSTFLKVWLNECQWDDDSKRDNLVYTVYANDDSGHVIGYGSVFRCSKYLRIGPLFADDFGTFLHILKQLVAHRFSGVSPENYELTVPSVNLKIIDFLITAGLSFVKTLNRSFTKKIEDLNYDKIYCFTGHTGVPE